MVAINTKTGKPRAVGNEAKNMIGRTPGNIIAIRPAKTASSPIRDTRNVAALHSEGAGCFGSVAISVPSGITEVEKRRNRQRHGKREKGLHH